MPANPDLEGKPELDALVGIVRASETNSAGRVESGGMHLTLHTDYAMRVLLYLAARPDETASAQTIADSYGISGHHIASVAKQLVREGLVEGIRGSHGGLRLARNAARTRVGDVVRKFEPDMHLVECFRGEGACRISPACRLARKGRALGAGGALVAVPVETERNSSGTSPALSRSKEMHDG